jgi:hypothetical protein
MAAPMLASAAPSKGVLVVECREPAQEGENGEYATAGKRGGESARQRIEARMIHVGEPFLSAGPSQHISEGSRLTSTRP